MFQMCMVNITTDNILWYILRGNFDFTAALSSTQGIDTGQRWNFLYM